MICHPGRRLVGCHYPLVTWAGAHRGHVQVHGHSHGNLRSRNARRADVGVDVDWPGWRGVWGEPLPAELVADMLIARPFDPVDHHNL